MEATPEFKVTDAVIASKGQRLGNYIIDVIIVYVCIFSVFGITSVIAGLIGYNDYLVWLGNISDSEGTIIFIAFMITYYTFLESYKSRTIAKYITRTMVVMEDGSRPNRMTSFKRSLCRVIPFNGLSLLTKNRSLHDSIPDTYVVKKDAFEREKELFYSFQEIGQPQA